MLRRVGDVLRRSFGERPPGDAGVERHAVSEDLVAIGPRREHRDEPERLVVGDEDRHLRDLHDAAHLVRHHAEDAHRVVLALQGERGVTERAGQSAPRAGFGAFAARSDRCPPTAGRRRRSATRVGDTWRRANHVASTTSSPYPLERVHEDRAAEQPSLTELHAEATGASRARAAVSMPSAITRAPMCPLNGQQRHDERASRAVRVDGLDQRPVDLDELGPQLGDDPHARVSRAGVVDRDAEAAGAQLRGDPLQPREVRHGLALAELEHDGCGVDARSHERPCRVRRHRAHRPACR